MMWELRWKIEYIFWRLIKKEYRYWQRANNALTDLRIKRRKNE